MNTPTDATPSADDFDALIMPAFEYLMRHGKREIALGLISLSGAFERSLDVNPLESKQP